MDLEMLNIQHSFGANHVLRNLDFRVGPGEIHALLGENGAGKSTLMNILGGVLQPDHGRILLDGKEAHFQGPSSSQAMGIGFVHQELSLINDLPIYLNLFLGSLHTKTGGFLDHDGMRRKAREFLANLSLDLDVDAYVRDLDPSYKQLLEIAREYLRDISLLILDEPTSSLNEDGIAQVFRLVRTLQERGVTSIFISHKLNEVMALCTDYTILRDGAVVRAGKIADTDAHELAGAMVGRNVVQGEHTLKQDASSDILFELRNFTDVDHRFRDINMTIRRTEILGVTGLQGDGRSELFQSVFGVRPLAEGELLREGRPVHFKDTHEAMQHGIAYVPKDRKENSIAEDLSIFQNGTISILDAYKNGPWIRESELQSVFETMAAQLRIQMTASEDPITSLSGGNQQKVILARWLLTKPELLILDNPTQGVDVGVKEEIYRLLEHLRNSGLTVVVMSNEADEIVRLCDRAYVMFQGGIAGCLSDSDINAKEIMQRATGAVFSVK